MTIGELIKVFPESEKIKREDIAECITKAMTEEKFYNKAGNKIYKKASELWPYERGLEYEDPKRVAWRLFFCGDGKGKQGLFYEWMDLFNTEFIVLHGHVHTFGEACQIAADEWTRMIFGNHIQNNGDQSETGGLTMVLGTIAKDNARRDIGNETAERFRQLCKDFYCGGCCYDDEEFGKMNLQPYCDYGPNDALGRLLEQAGVPHDRIGSICPWKTGITIDKHDNSVCVHGYQTERYL